MRSGEGNHGNLVFEKITNLKSTENSENNLKLAANLTQNSLSHFYLRSATTPIHRDRLNVISDNLSQRTLKSFCVIEGMKGVERGSFIN